MRVVIQRVSHAEVCIEGKESRAIDKGLLVLAGFSEKESLEAMSWIAGKIHRLRIFNDEEGKMNLALDDTGGKILLVSQFTLYASCKKGNRPSWNGAADPQKALQYYKQFHAVLEKECEQKVLTGEFGADMKILLINDGPVTIVMDSAVRA